MRAAIALALLAACASAPETKPVAPVETVRLVLRATRAPGAQRALATDLDSQMCAAAAQTAGFDVICAADVQAAAEVGQMRAALGQCDQTDDCVQQVQALAQGEQALTGELVLAEGAVTLTLVRASAGGEILRRVVRIAPDPAALQQQVEGAVAEALR